jgi:hypothetical protein
MRTLRGEPVDRPAVSFYEINGLEDTTDGNPFNIYSHPSWHPLIALARDRTDRIVMRGVGFKDAMPDPADRLGTVATFWRDGFLSTVRTLKVGHRTLTARSRRHPDVNTTWTEEHLLKDEDDVMTFLSVPPPEPGGMPDTAGVLQTEATLGDSGIVMIDTPDPLCCAAALFDMATYTVIAMTEPALFRRLLDRYAAVLHSRTEAIARALPGRLWRIYGPEYASPPYLPPGLFREYVVPYVAPMIQSIQRHGGFARIHSHGRLKDILDHIAATGCDGLDPIEPPPQGDVMLEYVRTRYGDRWVLFGNIEASDLENLPADQFAERVRRALREGMAGRGRGFVLLPSSCPYGRVLSDRTLGNYRIMVEMAEADY